MKYTLAQLESLMVKARLLGKDVESIPTACGHTAYFFKDIMDKIDILFIPDDVKEKFKDMSHYDRQTSSELLYVIGGKSLTDAYHLCKGCSAKTIDFSYFNTSNITDMSVMFAGCQAQSIDLSNFDTSKVTDMSDMFHDCKAQSLDLSSFDTSNVTDMTSMFSGCQVHSIDLSSFNTSKIENMWRMFNHCTAEVKTTDPKILDELNRR